MATKEERLMKERAKLRWCVHILGPDELVAKESYEAAEKHASELTDFLFSSDKPDVLCLPIVAMWPWSDAAHQDALAADATACAGTPPEPK